MRKPADRIRHALSFEVLGLLLSTPLAIYLFHLELHQSAVITIGASIVATIWNYLFNWGFDIIYQRVSGTTLKTLPARIIHALAFEAGLLTLLTPPIALYLNISIIEALVIDVSLAIFYVIYGFVFNWAYDRLFPLPEWEREK